MSKTTLRLALLLVTLATFTPAAAQTLRGSVVEAATDLPLAGAHVFVDGTALGDVSAADGSFAVQLPARRPLVVVVSMIGFSVETVTIDERYDLTELVEVRLEEDLISLDEFVIEAVKPRSVRRLRGRVEDLLFSSTPAGSRCEIENPEALEVINRSGLVSAVATEPIIVRNPYLGYRVSIHGLRLEGNERLYDFTGRLQFEELPAPNDRARNTRNDRRKKTYIGSRQHFMRDLVEGRLRTSGFEASLVSGPGRTSDGDTILEILENERSGAARVLMGDPGDLTRSLLFSGALLVRYTRERPHQAYSSFLRSINMPDPNTNDQVSWLVLPTGLAILDQNGVALATGNEAALSHFGYWSWQRVCDTLPADWSPES